MLNSVSVVLLKHSLFAHLMPVKLLLFTFYLNGGLHAISTGKQSEQMSNFWTVPFLKTESEPNFVFPHTPSAIECFQGGQK